MWVFVLIVDFLIVWCLICVVFVGIYINIWGFGCIKLLLCICLIKCCNIFFVIKKLVIILFFIGWIVIIFFGVWLSINFVFELIVVIFFNDFILFWCIVIIEGLLSIIFCFFI